MGIKCPRCGAPLNANRHPYSFVCQCGWWYSKLKNYLEARNTTTVIFQMVFITVILSTGALVGLAPDNDVRSYLKIENMSFFKSAGARKSEQQLSLKTQAHGPKAKKISKKTVKKAKRKIAMRR